MVYVVFLRNFVGRGKGVVAPRLGMVRVLYICDCAYKGRVVVSPRLVTVGVSCKCAIIEVWGWLHLGWEWLGHCILSVFLKR